MSKSVAEGLKELNEKQYYDYHKVKNITIEHDGRKGKFRNIVKDQATTLTRHNALNFASNRKALIRAFNDNGVVGMFNHYKDELKVAADKAEAEVNRIKGNK